jgi:hypothetical protein
MISTIEVWSRWYYVSVPRILQSFSVCFSMITMKCWSQWILHISNYNCMICWSWMLLLFYTFVYIPTRLHLVFQLLSSWVTALSWVWYGDFVFWVIEIMIIWWWSLRKGRQRDDSSSVVWDCEFVIISKGWIHVHFYFLKEFWED